MHVSGKIPFGSVASDQLLANDRGVSYQGELFRIEQGQWKIYGIFLAKLLDNRTNMKLTLKHFSAIVATVSILSIAGCGGGGASQSFTESRYEGTVINPGKSSQIVEISVDGNGNLTGRCSLISLSTGAITARATLTGTVNKTTGEFSGAGMFQCFIPPPPDGSGSGPVSISGSVPKIGVANGPLQVQDSLGILNGVITHAPTL